MQISRTQITGAVLAGGTGRRLGGIDKGWYELAGKPLIEHTLARIRHQCGPVVISANRSLPRYRALGYPVCTDDHNESCGPLAGLQRLLSIARTPYVLTVPVDTPLLPLDLADRLAAAIDADTPLAAARCAERVHLLHALIRRDMLADLQTALTAGIRRVGDWQSRLDRVMVDWPDGAGFANINTEADARAVSTGL